MKRNQGFTLIELLVVILILTAVGLLLVPTVLDQVQSFQSESYEDQLNTIELAAQTWGTDHLYTLEFYEGDTVTITLGQLKGEGYLDYQFVNPSTKKNFPDDMEIIVTKKGKNLKYHVNAETGTKTNYSGKDQPRLTLKGDVVLYMQAGSTYIEPGIISKNATGNVSITYQKNGLAVSNLNQLSTGTYTVTYQVRNANTMTAIKRTIIVK